ncbi:glycosyltransferase family 4 protein [Candidatus Gracilibacteria bacterium]|nr:glycosyltransferase family 4 protein [Candidatus Gracilibacteria bacterium]
MNKKKVLIMNLTPRGGMLHYSSQFCNELMKRNDIELKVGIASYHDGSLYDHSTSFIKIRTNPNPLSFVFDSLNIFYHLYFLFQIIVFRPQVVHFLDNHPWYILYAPIFKCIGMTLYVTQHDPVLHSGEDSSLLGKISIQVNKTLRNISDQIMVHGDILKKQVIENYNVPENKILSIRHGSYTFFNTWAQGLAVKKNTFLFFGRIVDYKGLDVLLESLEYISHNIPDFKLIIAGPGDISKYSKLIKKYSDNIELYNFEILPENAYRYFEVSEFVVLPYKDASGTGVVPVAYCFEKPVIVTDVGELPSVVQENETGSIIIPSDPKTLGEKIVEFLEQKDRVVQMGKQAKKWSDRELSWKDIIKSIY